MRYFRMRLSPLIRAHIGSSACIRLQFWLLMFSSLLYSSSVFASTDELKDLFKILRDNNSITPLQYETLNKAAERRQTNEKNKKVEEDTDEILIRTKGGLEASTYDGEYSFEIGGTIMVDAATFDSDLNQLGDGTELRKAEIQIEGLMFGEWEYELEIDFENSDVDVNDAYLKYVSDNPGSVKIGQFKEPFSLEELTGSSKQTFMERSLINEFAPGRNIGISGNYYWENWTVTAGIFGDDINDDPSNEGDEGWGVTGRMTWAPFHTKRNVWHLGVGFSHRVPDEDNKTDFATRPESHLTDVKYANTDDILNVKNSNKYGLELASVHGSFSTQAEYIRVDISRSNNAEDVTFDGWYIYASYFLTGESRKYKFKSGKFGNIKPRRDTGAWEIALRYSTIDLNDGAITGGEENNITLGLNWYVNKKIRIMTNYIMVDTDTNANDAGSVIGNDQPNILQLRMQVNF